MKFMLMMMGGQAHLVLKSAVTGWRELLATLRQERIMEKPKEKNSWYKAATRRGLGKLRVEEEEEEEEEEPPVPSPPVEEEEEEEEREEEEKEEGGDCA